MTVTGGVFGAVFNEFKTVIRQQAAVFLRREAAVVNLTTSGMAPDLSRGGAGCEHQCRVGPNSRTSATSANPTQRQNEPGRSVPPVSRWSPKG